MTGKPIYSQEVEEILTRKPSRMVRYGMVLLTLVVMLLLVLAFTLPIPQQTGIRAETVSPESGSMLEISLHLPVNQIDLNTLQDPVMVWWEASGEKGSRVSKAILISRMPVSSDSLMELRFRVTGEAIPPGTSCTVILPAPPATLFRLMFHPVLSFSDHD